MLMHVAVHFTSIHSRKPNKTKSAQDGSDFREPPNEVPTSLRQRRPPQRSTAENEARREVGLVP